ncbi:NAD(P)-binding protein [Agilicoccus flavus]|uniref:NAD(P)-binding protein n=1 Tax=Agilicoccus flavus TaxID=2775968 RepID=UPI001CF6F7AC|nr:FAD/NAD(P)-binding protein [Agilicoccus flavus]
MRQRRRRIAIVGAGPSGLFTAQALAAQDRVPVRIDLLERLPTPYGLLRYGVAPDHENIKAVATALARTFDHDDVRFWGLIEFGRDTTRAELLDAYDAVVYAVGAAEDVHMGVPGEDLQGSRSAREFVAWYGGHPDARPQHLRGVRGAATVGVGNVAVDVARILLKEPHMLADTDMPAAVLDELRRHTVRDVWVVGRRGPQHASYTTRELRELLDTPGVAVHVSPGAFDGIDDADLDRRTRGNVEALRAAAARARPDAARRLHFAFWRRPVEMDGLDGRLRAMVLERTRIGGDGALEGTGDLEAVPVQLVLRAIGYRGSPLPDVPFEPNRAIVPNDEGRVLGTDGRPLRGEYCVGWVKRGPIGVIGTNKSDAAQTVGHLLDDLAATPDAPAPTLDLREAMRRRGFSPSTFADWRDIDAAETALGRAQGRPRTKIATWTELLGYVDADRAGAHADGATLGDGDAGEAAAGADAAGTNLDGTDTKTHTAGVNPPGTDIKTDPSRPNLPGTDAEADAARKASPGTDTRTDAAGPSSGGTDTTTHAATANPGATDTTTHAATANPGATDTRTHAAGTNPGRTDSGTDAGRTSSGTDAGEAAEGR